MFVLDPTTGRNKAWHDHQTWHEKGDVHLVGCCSVLCYSKTEFQVPSSGWFVQRTALLRSSYVMSASCQCHVMVSWHIQKFKKLHNSSLTSFIRSICLLTEHAKKYLINDLGTGDFIMGILDLLGVCPGSPSWDGRRRARWSWQQEENVLFHLLAWLAQISWLITQEITLTQADSLKLTCVALGGHLPAPVLSPDSQTSPSASSVSPAWLWPTWWRRKEDKIVWIFHIYLWKYFQSKADI